MERKLATVLFVDLVASTELLANVDPEVARRRVSRFFDQVSHCIVTHGGTVEKFAGEAVADESESTFATGEAVNLASRLQAAAAPNEILVGPGAASLARGRVELE